MNRTDTDVKMKMFLREIAAKADGMSEGTNADGGYLVGSDIVKGVIDRIFLPQYYTAQASRYLITQGKGSIKVPLDLNPLQSAPSTGVRAYWQAEAALINTNKAVLGSLTLTPGNLVVMVPATNELVEDTVNFEEMFMTWAGKALQRKLASEMIVGTGAVGGVGTGGSTHGATLTTALAATPSDAELRAAFNLLHPAAILGASWYVSQAVYMALYGTSGYTTVDKTLGKLTIMGLPVEVCPYFGAAKNHIMLGNFSGYGIGYKEPNFAKSLTVYYSTNQQAFRLVLRIAGGPQVANSVCDDGTTRAYFVIPS